MGDAAAMATATGEGPGSAVGGGGAGAHRSDGEDWMSTFCPSEEKRS